MNEERFVKLKQEIPHIMIPSRIKSIEEKMNVDGLSEKMLSDEWIELQRDGWKYFRVAKPNDRDPIPLSDDYKLLFIGNIWGDAVIFVKI